jgi:hypothetical protein
MPNPIFIGYRKSGEHFFINDNILQRGLILRGERCIRLVRNIAYQLQKQGNRVIVISLARNFSHHVNKILPEADMQTILGYIFRYDADKESYHGLLASSICLGMQLGDEYEYVLKDAIKALADAEGAGGVYAILSMLDACQTKGIELVKRKMQQLTDLYPSTGKHLDYSCTANLWKIPSPDARIAVSLSLASKFSVYSGGFIFILGWEFISHLEKSQKRRLQHLLSEITGLSKLIVLQTYGENSTLFGAEIVESGPLFLIRGRSEILFAAPELIFSITEQKDESSRLEANEDAFVRVLTTIQNYKGSTLAGLMHYLSGEIDEDQFKVVIQNALLRGLIKFAYDSQTGVRVLELSDKGREFLEMK